MKHTLPSDDDIYTHLAHSGGSTKTNLLAWASRQVGRPLGKHSLRNVLMRLEARGLIERSQDPWDKRVVVFRAKDTP